MSTHGLLELTLVSAKELKNVNFLSPLRVYAEAGFPSDPRGRQRTPADRHGRKNPNWNATLRIPIPNAADASRLTLEILLRTENPLGDRVVGEVHVPLADLESAAVSDDSGKPRFMSYQVRRPSGRGKGELNISYRFLDRTTEKAEPSVKMAEEPVTAYPVYSQPYTQPGLYPPYQGGYQQPAGYGYGYGYSQAQNPGYGGVPVVRPQQPAKKNMFGMGLGAGLLGGALGGMLIGDIVSDAAAYDGGYDAGFGDASFDF